MFQRARVRAAPQRPSCVAERVSGGLAFVLAILSNTCCFALARLLSFVPLQLVFSRPILVLSIVLGRRKLLVLCSFASCLVQIFFPSSITEFSCNSFREDFLDLIFLSRIEPRLILSEERPSQFSRISLLLSSLYQPGELIFIQSFMLEDSFPTRRFLAV